jgi:hypothetical protein
MELLDDEAYDTLKDADVDLTEIELAEMKLYVYRKNIYGVPTKKSRQRLYNTYVEDKSAYEVYCRNKRFRLSSIHLTENKQIFAKKMDALMKRQDYNLDMYKKLMSTHHKLSTDVPINFANADDTGACTPVHASRCSDQRVA